MTEANVAAYVAKDRPELCGTYRGYRICGMGPPSSGATTVYAILKQLERFDLGALGKDSPTFWHLFAESQRLAFADRERWLGDPDFVSVPATGLMDPAYLAARGALIDPAKRCSQAWPPARRRASRSPRPTATSRPTTAPRTSSRSTARATR